ncbi:MAG: thrombospondin type 3 repeat-containing protein [Polyangiaceae bacterium]
MALRTVGVVVVLGLGAAALSGAACGGDGGSGGDGASSQGGGATGGGGEGGGTGGGGGSDDYVVETCTGAPEASPGAAVCAVQPGDARVMLVGDVLTPGKVYEGGAVVLDAGGAISCVGCACFADAAAATQVVCPDAVVSAGLINAHDHVGWMNGRPWVATEHNVDPSLRWEHRHDWRTGANGHPEVNVDGGGANVDEKAFGEIRFVLSGATGIFGSGDLSGIVRDLDATGDGDNGLGDPGAGYDTFPLGDSSGTQLDMDCGGYSVPNPASSFFDSYAPHVAEGINAAARNEFLCLTGTGAGSKVALDERSSIIHGVGLTADEIAHMAGNQMKLIWSPRTNVSLYGDTAPVTVYDRLGVTIGLGTDWIPSGSMNMLRELACAAELNRQFYGEHFSDHDLWQMATLGSAAALAFDDVTGKLAVGYAGDVAIFAKQGREHYTAVVDAEVGDVALVLRGGLPLSGNDAVVEALESGCDTLDVCGVPKRVCTMRDTGKSLSAIQAAAGAYPLFFCGVPDDEPTCLPARTLQNDSVNGSTNYAGMSSMDDTDGDGVANASDNCPTVFNPVRPVDDMQQANADGDALGDACDPCIFDATDSCSGSNDDIDGDGVVNTQDNCPTDANADQADADMDGKGDVCDACPNDPNPGSTACPGESTTIFAIQDVTDPNHPTEGTRVRVECIITAIGNNLVWCQDMAGGPYSGISVFVGGPATYQGTDAPVMLGDRLLLDGDYAEYFDVSQLENPVFTFVAAGSVPAPVVLSSADIATGGSMAEAYEGVLVRVQNVAVTNVNPDAPSDFDEFEVTGGLRIDDLVVDGGGTGGMLDNTYALGASFSSITGVHHYSFSNFKLLPRTTADLVP